MRELCPFNVHSPNGIWPILCQSMAILAKLLDVMEFKFVLPIIYINFNIQTNFEVNRTQIGHFVPKNHKNGHISKPHFAQMSFTKKPTTRTFFNKFV